MKKLFAMILSMVLCLSLCACGDNGDAAESIEDKVIDSVKSQITVRVMFLYDTSAIRNITTYIDEISENKFEVTGKVTVCDKYGDPYTGKYDATVIYDPELDHCDVSLDLGELYKD